MVHPSAIANVLCCEAVVGIILTSIDTWVCCWLLGFS